MTETLKRAIVVHGSAGVHDDMATDDRLRLYDSAGENYCSRAQLDGRMDVRRGVNQWQPGKLNAASEVSAERIVADSNDSELMSTSTNFDNRTGNRCAQDVTPPFAGIVVVQRNRRIAQSPKCA
jgi:hypothetical protein